MKKILIFVLSFIVLSLGLVSAIGTLTSGVSAYNSYGMSNSAYMQNSFYPQGQGYSLGYQYFQPNFNSYYSQAQIASYWPIIDQMQKGKCDNSADFLLMIPPAGCQPTVVTSDLLEEQNVPVFCQLSSLKINPLIQVSSIKSISFQGGYGNDSKYISDVSFHPAQAAIRSYKTLLGDPISNNIGYVVIILKQNPKEADMPKKVSGNLTATIYYDAEKAFGTGKSEYYLPIMSDSDWQDKYKENGFWYGKGFVRVEDINNGSAKIGIYTDKDTLFQEVTLGVGQTSKDFYFPGFYCKASLKVKLNSVVGPEDQAQINVDGSLLWVRKGSRFLNDKCYVRDLFVSGDGVGNVQVSCGSQTYKLAIQKKAAKVSVNNVESSANVGESVGGLKLAYVGNYPKSLGGNGFVVLATSDVKDINQVYNRVSYAYGKSYSSTSDFIKAIEGSGFYVVDGAVKKINVSKGNEVNFIFNGIVDQEIKRISGDVGQAADYYFSNMDDTVNYLIDNYPTTEGVASVNGAWAEQAMLSEIESAKTLGRYDDVTKLSQKFIELYPNSKNVYSVQTNILKAGYDMSKASAFFTVDNEQHSVSASDFKPYDPDMKKARVSVGGAFQDVHEKDKLNVGESDYVIIDKINPNAVTMSYYSKNNRNGVTITSGKVSTSTNNVYSAVRSAFSVMSGDSYTDRNFAGAISVSSIDVKEFAYVSLIPNVDYTRSMTNFTFSIGIEKRAIKLSPEKTQDMIANLNKTIDKWEGFNNNLAQLIKGWKGACFATSALLMAKSFVNGLNGEAQARQEVMQAYKLKCKEAAYKDMSATQCYSNLSVDIERDVKLRTDMINSINNNIKPLETAATKAQGSGLFGDTIVDNNKLLTSMKSQIKPDCTTSYVFKDSSGKTSLKTSEDGKNNGISLGSDQCIAIDSIDSTEAIRAIMAKQSSQYQSMSDGVKKMYDTQMSSLLQPAYQRQAADVKGYQLIADLKKTNGGLLAEKVTVFTQPTTTATQVVASTGQTLGSLSGSSGGDTSLLDKINVLRGNNKLSPNTPAEISSDGYVLVFPGVIDSTKGMSVAKGNVYHLTGNGAVEEVKDSATIKRFQQDNFVSGGDCSNTITEPKIKYFETDPYKGMPGIVPFDLKKGWYAKVSQGIGGLLSSQQKSYQASGQVTFFYICNVGKDHLQETSDDLCQSFDVNNYNKVDIFQGCPTLKAADVKKLAESAQEAIRQAAQQYGKTSVNILGQTMSTGAPMGTEAVGECQDFMSNDDCKLLFNVCDPVICPSSRCDLGGKYKVADVVQSGIIGSILLCLPNFKEGIMVPVCLTGINAGIDSLISILKSERECLQNSLATGQHTGICDEITSVYLCEFFWRQFAPVMNLLVPKLIETAYGQNVRGGGEYMTVMKSWDNLQNSISYFKDNYAQNSFKAFQARSVEEAGGTFCKAFMGSTSSANILDNLLQPESPDQVYAWFSETPFTEATVPSTSHYKVYYHIFAGKDISAQFQVYLRNPPASSYYQQNQMVVVKTGYINKGSSADESIDFTAPAGYKELCVVINAQEHCGFKQVSTDFALNYIKDKYITEQANQTDITTESQCISGSPSMLGLATSPNIQSGVQTAVSPSINMLGVVRICANQNPGSNFDPNSVVSASGTPVAVDTSGVAATKTQQQSITRWVKVGYCGDPNLICWLDTQSVKSSVSAVAAIENSTSNLWANSYGNNDTLFTEQESGSIISKVSSAIANEDEFKKKIAEQVASGDSAATIEAKINVILGSSTSNGLIYQLDNLGGTKEIAARGSSNSVIAQGLYLKAQVYRLVIQALAEKFATSQTSNGGANIFSEGDSVTYLEDESVWVRDSNGQWTSQGQQSVVDDEIVGSWIDKGLAKKVEVSNAESSSSTSSSPIVSSEGSSNSCADSAGKIIDGSDSNSIPFLVENTQYYLNFGKLSDNSGSKWLFSVDNNPNKRWREITSDNEKLSFLYGKELKGGIDLIKSRQKDMNRGATQKVNFKGSLMSIIAVVCDADGSNITVYHFFDFENNKWYESSKVYFNDRYMENLNNMEDFELNLSENLFLASANYGDGLDSIMDTLVKLRRDSRFSNSHYIVGSSSKGFNESP